MKSALSIESCNCLALRKAARAVTAYYDRHLAGTGLSSVQFSILATIEEHPGIGMQELSGELVMDRTSLVRAIQPLARDGYVTQQAAPNNARKRALSLSDDGRNRFLEAQKYWYAAQSAFEKSIGTSNASALRNELTALGGSFQVQNESAY